MCTMKAGGVQTGMNGRAAIADDHQHETAQDRDGDDALAGVAHASAPRPGASA